ncbi:MAG: hypothetical protein WBD70_29870, partial [Mycobacterium sp.]
PSLDEVFFALTTENTGEKSVTRIERTERIEAVDHGDTYVGRHRLERNGDTSATCVEVGEPGPASGRHRLEHTADTSATRVDAEVLP